MIKPNAIFKNGMVLQHNSIINVFGKTDCEQIKISFCDEIYDAVVSDDYWIARIETKEYVKPLTMVITGIMADGSHQELTIDDILLGEVWIAGGQSNMELELQNSENGRSVMQEADYEYIRFYNVPKYPFVDDELLTCEDNTSWRSVKSGNCADMSAVAYYFATKLYERLNVPIGIVDCYWGGTSATCWVSPDSLKGINEVKDYLEDWNKVCQEKSDEIYDKELDEYNGRVNKWQDIVNGLKENDPNISNDAMIQIAGDYPWPPPRGRKSPFRPFGLYESMVKRITPYKARGVIYYQGEEDAERASYYSKLNSAVIKQWRDDFDNPDMHFYITQLPMFIAKDEQDNGQWGILRLEQEKCSILNENVGIAVIVDCGEFDNIHPIDKKTPGYRLAEQALLYTYGLPDAYRNMSANIVGFDKNTCDICLDNTYGELHYRQSDGIMLTSKQEDRVLKNGIVDKGVLFGFEVMNREGEVYNPDIEVANERIRLVGRTGDELTLARYAMFNYGVANVYNKHGLPLMPFEYTNDK